MMVNCDVIRDLLPLYADDACSAATRAMIDEHLEGCPDCRNLLGRLQKTELEKSLKEEKNTVLEFGAKRFKQRSAQVGAVIAGLFMIPILVCLIVNLFSAAPLGWFFIVLASLIVAASLIIVPLMVPEDKAFWTFCAFCASLMILLAVVCLYTRGSWFWIASSASLFGLAVVFLPFVVKARPLQKWIGRSSRLIVVLGIDAALFVNMMNMIFSRGKFTLKTIVFALGVIAGIGLVATEIMKNREAGNEQK